MWMGLCTNCTHSEYSPPQRLFACDLECVAYASSLPVHHTGLSREDKSQRKGLNQERSGLSEGQREDQVLGEGCWGGDKLKGTRLAEQVGKPLSKERVSWLCRSTDRAVLQCPMLLWRRFCSAHRGVGC